MIIDCVEGQLQFYFDGLTLLHAGFFLFNVGNRIY